MTIEQSIILLVFAVFIGLTLWAWYLLRKRDK